MVLLATLCLVLPLAQSCGGKDVSRVEMQMSRMTLRQKVCQMFVVRPEAIAAQSRTEGRKYVTSLDSWMTAFFKEYPAGGFCLFAGNIKTPEQTLLFTKELHALEPAPLICIDEEGGRVARLALNGSFGLKRFDSMGGLAAAAGESGVYEASRYIGEYTRQYGFDVDFAPVADVNTNPENVVIGTRAFSSDPDVAARMVVSSLKGFEESGITACLKHFPGHGDTREDTHSGYAASLKTWAQIDSCEMVSFKAGIAAGAPMIMAAHIAVPNVTGTDVPATLSQVLLTDKLRGELGFEGIIVTDALEMGAIAKHYSQSEAAVLAVQAGADILLMPSDYRQAVDGVVEAVENGQISIGRIDQSVRRILELKQFKQLL